MFLFFQILTIAFSQALRELRVNKLRTFLSLLGVTIGIFCIVSVSTILDSLEINIKKNMSALGDDVVYFQKMPWMPEDGEYKWWEYFNRPALGMKELIALDRSSQTIEASALVGFMSNITLKRQEEEISGISAYCVTENFNRIQYLDIGEGRYFSQEEIASGKNFVVIGHAIYTHLFPQGIFHIGQRISVKGRKYDIIGVLSQQGSSMAGIEFDESIFLSYYSASSYFDISNSYLMSKPRFGISTDEMAIEAEGILRAVRKVEPGSKNNFAINRLSEVAERMSMIFGAINLVGWVVTIFSLLVGAFGIANIMFVSVKERTKFIGLKKAVGAKPSTILIEFLTEAVLLCIIGGLAGIIMVMILGWILSKPIGFPIVVSANNFLMGIFISAIVGVLAGFIPARSASKMHPVQAIRSS